MFREVGKCKAIITFRLIPCGTKISREFNFVDCRFFCFAGANFREFRFQTLRQGTNFRGFLASFSLVFDVRNLYRAARDLILSCLFYL